MRILVTNDDGVDSPGLWALAEVARDAGHEVLVAAPSSEFSGSGASIVAQQEDGRIRFRRHDVPALDGVDTFAVDAAPALITLVAAHGTFGSVPELVLSGINRGANLGHVVLHSGTVGAALTAAVNGIRALAVSLHLGADDGERHWATAAAVARGLLPLLAEEDPGVVLNLNVPNVPPGKLPALREARLASFGIVQTTMTVPFGGDFRLTVADAEAPAEPGSDAALLAAGFAPVTRLRPVGDAPLGFDLPG